MKVLKKRFRLEFSLENAAFAGEDCATEVARILREAADAALMYGVGGGRVRDINGNRVGFYAVSEDEVEV